MTARSVVQINTAFPEIPRASPDFIELSNMNLNLRNIDPEARGLLYRLQAEKNLPNLAETIKFLVKNYYKKEK